MITVPEDSDLISPGRDSITFTYRRDTFVQYNNHNTRFPLSLAHTQSLRTAFHLSQVAGRCAATSIGMLV